MAAITKEYHFEAAHQLPNHKGKCARLHGHSYRVLVSVASPITDPSTKMSDAGMVVDFDEIDRAMDPLIENYLDHRFLNDTLQIPRTTAEMIGVWIFKALFLRTTFSIGAVEVFETAKASATVMYRDYEQWGEVCTVPED